MLPNYFINKGVPSGSISQLSKLNYVSGVDNLLAAYQLVADQSPTGEPINPDFYNINVEDNKNPIFISLLK